MDVKCFPLAGEQNYTVEDFQSYLGTRVPGVYSDDTNLAVTAQASPDMSVKVSSGLAWLQAADLRGVVFPMTEAVDLTIETADALQARIDTVVIGLDKTRRTGYVKIVKGLLGGGATAPVRDANYFELVLAEVLVRAATSSINAGDIADQRADETVCGLVRDGVQSIPSATFQAQAEQIILEMRVAIADALADAGIIDNLTTADAYKALSANMGKKLQDEKAPKASPTFTGTATIPTAVVTTLNATTANANVIYSPSFVGMICYFAGNTASPGWLKYDGSILNREAYPALWAYAMASGNIVSEALWPANNKGFSTGDGATTFRLGNLCDGSFIRSVGGNAAALGVTQADAVKAHTHGIASGSARAEDGPDSPIYPAWPPSNGTQSLAQADGDVETRPRNTAMTPYIKY